MKRLLIMFAMILCFSLANATHYFKTTDYAYRFLVTNNVWSEWSDWAPNSNIVIMDDDLNTIQICLPETVLKFNKKQFVGTFVDSDGYTQGEYIFEDEHGLKCKIRLRKLSYNKRQIYIHYTTLIFVYNIVPILK